MTHFTPDNWSSLSRLLHEALDLSPEARVEWLGDRRAENRALADELEALLERESAIDEGFLSAKHSPSRDGVSTLAGQTLGAYVLESPLGQGGMGSVWLARRSDGRFDGVAASE